MVRGLSLSLRIWSTYSQQLLLLSPGLICRGVRGCKPGSKTSTLPENWEWVRSLCMNLLTLDPLVAMVDAGTFHTCRGLPWSVSPRPRGVYCINPRHCQPTSLLNFITNSYTMVKDRPPEITPLSPEVSRQEGPSWWNRNFTPLDLKSTIYWPSLSDI